MWRLSSVLAILATVIAACTSPQALQPSAREEQSSPAGEYSHRVGTTQVVLYWNCLRPDPGVLRLEGVAYSPYFSELRFLEFEFVGVDRNDHVVSATRGTASDIVLHTNQPSPFRLDLREAGNEARFDLYYWYQSQGGLRSGGNSRVLVAGPLVASPLQLAQATARFLARDVCSDTQHRIRKTAR